MMMIKERIGANSGKTKIENLIFNLHILPMHFAEREQRERERKKRDAHKQRLYNQRSHCEASQIVDASVINPYFLHPFRWVFINICGLFFALFICLAYGTQWRINFHIFFSFIQPFNPV